MNNYKPTLLIVFSFLFAISACSSLFPSNPAQPSSDVQIRETQNRTVATTETIRINNCGGKAESKQVSERSFAVNVDASFGASVGYAIVQGTISAKYGHYRNVSRRQELVAPPGTNMEITLKWTEQEWIGTVVTGSQSGNYNVRAPLEVEQISSRDLGCGGVQAPTSAPPTSALPPIVQVPPPQASTRVPPTLTSVSPLRPHTTVSIGSGAFSRVTFSDGQAPYDENWLWANNHFNIQRIRREEQPDGCDVAQYRVSKIWVSAASVAKVTVNGSEVGTISNITPIQKHGYIADVSLNPGDRICLSPVPAGGFHIVFGPDIYYHYDSYCYRGNC